MKKRTFLVLILVFLVLAGLYALGYYLAVRPAKDKSAKVTGETKVPQTEEEVQEILLPLREDIPVKKSLAAADNSRVRYVLEGSFTSIEKGEIADSGADYLAGRFVLKDDPLKREIEVFIGSGTGMLALGEYSGSFQGNSSWQVEKVNNLLPRINGRQPVLLRLEMSLVSNTYPYYGKVLDNLYREYASGDFQLLIPAEFSLVAEGVGVIREL